MKISSTVDDNVLLVLEAILDGGSDGAESVFDNLH